MSEDEAERTIDADAETDRAHARSSTEPTGFDEVTDADRAADSFLSLESDFRGLRGGPDRLSGFAVDVSRVAAADVPDGYPVTITTDEALRLRVRGEEVGGATGVGDAVYFEWPPSTDGPLSRLLALRDVDPERFAELNGTRVPLAIEDGFLVPRVPPAGRRGSPNGVYGIAGGLAATVGLLGLVATGVASLSSLPVLVALAVLTFVVLPLSTYLDAWHLLSTTDWEGGPPFWATLAALPGINVVSSLWYLSARRQAEPL